ncbi:Dyp-type peroxidase [Bacteroides sp.]|uniref:Dyp-type peroxidase n=1 Tax=Bacteroides sp. TaxID=29523 RepID=UPI002631CC3D|nr:Dyp-type peroxidase [Bacteroides sp.]MDD3038893.1 Dyp-type peroxidase [Bacteroides sp.]
MNPNQCPFSSNFPQDVVEKQGENAIFIVYGLKQLPATIDKVKDVCTNFSALIRSMRNRFPDVQFSCTMGFGADAWSYLFPEREKPKELVPFQEIKGDRYTAVSTHGDLLFHIRSGQMGLCFEFASIIDEKLKGVVEPIDETHGFRYLDGKAIIGFVDGTENPAIDENPYFFAVIGEEDPNFKGGSYAFVQKYIHNMVAWNSLSVEEQEKVIGRHKFNDVELSDEEKPKNAHNAVTNIGDDLKIVRANMPFANTSRGEYGTYFIGYASTFSTTHQMLENMFIGNPVGNTDRLLDFSTPITGTLFFVPSYDLLGKLGDE